MTKRVEIDHSPEGVSHATDVLNHVLDVLQNEAYRGDHAAAELYRGLLDASEYTHIVEKPESEQ